MIINIQMLFHYDIISMPIEKINELKSGIKKFDDFIHCKSNDHPFWTYINGKKITPEVSTESLIWWLNNKYFSKGEKAKIISQNNKIDSIDTSIYSIYL